MKKEDRTKFIIEEIRHNYRSIFYFGLISNLFIGVAFLLIGIKDYYGAIYSLLISAINVIMMGSVVLKNKRLIRMRWQQQ